MQRDRKRIVKCNGLALGLLIAALPLNAWAADGGAGAEEAGAPALGGEAGAGGTAAAGGKPSAGGVAGSAGGGGVNVAVGPWPDRDLVHDNAGRACSFATGPRSTASGYLALAVGVAALWRRRQR